jgi:hypothetical protein
MMSIHLHAAKPGAGGHDDDHPEKALKMVIMVVTTRNHGGKFANMII